MKLTTFSSIARTTGGKPGSDMDLPHPHSAHGWPGFMSRHLVACSAGYSADDGCLSNPQRHRMTFRTATCITILALFALLSGCATPVGHSNTPMSTYDRDTEYSVEDNPKGFALNVYYSRYQFFPESDAVTSACKSALTSIAWEISDRRGREIEQINEQRIRLSLGRNGLTGITSCSATAAVEWKDSPPKTK